MSNFMAAVGKLEACLGSSLPSAVDMARNTSGQLERDQAAIAEYAVRSWSRDGRIGFEVDQIFWEERQCASATSSRIPSEERGFLPVNFNEVVGYAELLRENERSPTPRRYW